MSELYIPKVHIVIPARYASSRLPGKPLVDLDGLPMIVRVFNQAKLAFDDENTHILVATDDQRIVDVLDVYDIPHVMTKVEHESGTDRIAEVVTKQGWHDDDVIINIQGDEPLVPVDMLAAFKQYCLKQKALEMATISAPLHTLADASDSNAVKVVASHTGRALYFSRSAIPFVRDVPFNEWPADAFSKHIGVYAYRCRSLMQMASLPMAPLEKLEKLEQLRAIWNDISIYVMPWSTNPPHGVDTPSDVERVVNILKGTE